MNIRAVQQRLTALGFKPGFIDGIMGPNTRSAIEAFQRREGIAVTGHVDVMTASALNKGQGPVIGGIEPPWLSWARAQIGVHERRQEAKVLGWLKSVASWVTSASTSWCGAFMAVASSTTLPTEAIPGNPLGAREWLKYGRPLEQPAVGCVVVFWRVSRSSWQGHVGYVVGRDQRGNLMVLGGNQSDEVNIRPFANDRVLGYRWPNTFPLPAARGLPLLTSGGRVSTNEA
jgi:uncharacterized protein (TIGR02594 family)